MSDNKVKLADIRPPMSNGMLMCEVEKKNNSQNMNSGAIDPSE
jgi:hypothetical protein